MNDTTTSLNDALDRADRWSPFLRGQMRRFPDLVALIEGGDLDGALAACRVEPVATSEVPRALRLTRGRLALALALGDLAGVFDFETVTGRLSDFADQALDAAISAAIEMQAPGEAPRGLAAIALGKHGGRELNYSSDIDPIFLFDPVTLPRRARDEPIEAATRLVTRVLEILQRRDGDGYVFRVDLRLRPNPEVTPVALPVDAAIGYYEASALGWERSAFIRSRAAAGDRALGQGFLDAIRPFIWRRTLDFGAIRELRAMSQRIRDHHRVGQVLDPGYDLKRGRGGIREVEFFTQMHQMIHGGREPALRAAATLDALDALAAAGRIERADTLSRAYRILRTVEHRLQMVDDRQTHSLPADADAIDGVARLHGFADGDELIDLLRPHVDAVGAIYDGLEGEPSDGLPRDPIPLAGTLDRAGLDGVAAAERIARWRGGAIRALRTPAALDALEAVLPQLMTAFAAAPDPAIALLRFESLIEKLPTAINLFRLLEARPQLLTLLTDILSHAPTLALALAQRASLLDRLIDATAFELPGPVEEIAAQLAAGDGSSVEERLDRVRQHVGEARFALGAQIVTGASDPLDVAKAYARVAEAAIGTVADAIRSDFETAHGRVPGSEFIILALGRMGGGELTHASDLDLIYLFTGDFAAESNGAKPLGAVLYYDRLAQRVSAGLSVPTAAGALYEVDTRLRPSGAQGPLVVSLAAFEKYQHDDAWTWEHMALCRARPVYGSQQARAATQAIIDAVLAQPRDTPQLRADAVKMRTEMARHKPAKGRLDVKLESGGLVDLEFAVHVAQLPNNTAFHPDLGEALAALVNQDLASAAMIDAHRILTRVLVTMRLMAPDGEPPAAATQLLIARACDFDNWDSLLAALDAVRQDVTKFWQQVGRIDDDQ